MGLGPVTRFPELTLRNTFAVSSFAFKNSNNGTNEICPRAVEVEKMLDLFIFLNQMKSDLISYSASLEKNLPSVLLRASSSPISL